MHTFLHYLTMIFCHLLPRGSLKLPWNPILAKDSTYPIQEEWNISNAMWLCPKSFDFRVQRFCCSIGRPVQEIVQDVFFLAFDGIPCRLDFLQCTGIDFIVPLVQLVLSFLSCYMRLEDCPHFTDERVGFFHLRVLPK